MSVLFDTAPGLSERSLRELLARAHGIDTVRVRVAVPEERRFTTAVALGVDPLNAPGGEACFFDTPDLALHYAGVAVSARRVADQRPSLSVTARPVVPHELPARAGPVQALPARGRGAARLLRLLRLAAAHARAVRARGRHRRAEARRARLLSKRQRAFLAAHAPADSTRATCDRSARSTCSRWRWRPRAGRRLRIEVWTYPDSSRVIVVSARAKRGNALNAVGELRSYLVERGIGLSAVQQTKLRAAFAHLADSER